MSSYIPIDKNKIPYRYNVRLNKKTYTMELHYNSAHDFFTVAIDTITETLTCGEKLVLGKPLLSEHPYLNFPLVVPVDKTGQADRITWSNFGNSVLLYVGGDSE